MSEYRYRLERKLADTGFQVCFIGINPSTADDTTDDQTVRKWKGFARQWGAGSFVVGNLFAQRATNVKDLRAAPDTDHLKNLNHLAMMIAAADVVVPCWGALIKLPNEALRVQAKCIADFVRSQRKPLLCLGKTKRGDPRHPLMLAYSTPLEKWT